MGVFTNTAERGAGDRLVTSGVRAVRIGVVVSCSRRDRDGIKYQSLIIIIFLILTM